MCSNEIMKLSGNQSKYSPVLKQSCPGFKHTFIALLVKSPYELHHDVQFLLVF